MDTNICLQEQCQHSELFFKCAQWNVCGWSTQTNLSGTNEWTIWHDLLCETWSWNNKTPQNIWYGQNRLTMSRGIRRSGVLWILVRFKWATTFNITTLESPFEGVLWITFEGKLSKYAFCVCVCYLLPSTSGNYVNSSLETHGTMWTAHLKLTHGTMWTAPYEQHTQNMYTTPHEQHHANSTMRTAPYEQHHVNSTMRTAPYEQHTQNT